MAVTLGNDEAMGIISFLVFGLVVGALARLIKPGKQNLSILATLGLGVVGSLIGGVVAVALGTGDFGELNIIGSIVAIIAAVLLIGVAESITGGRSSARH
ncbi:GlsB/YeaQ/YmgE family stress response membrane protein [Modestobacter sp. SYSU DS0511]